MHKNGPMGASFRNAIHGNDLQTRLRPKSFHILNSGVVAPSLHGLVGVWEAEERRSDATSLRLQWSWMELEPHLGWG